MILVTYVPGDKSYTKVKTRIEAEKQIQRFCEDGVYIKQCEGRYTYYPGKLIYKVEIAEE
jgi:hypothetical protein